MAGAAVVDLSEYREERRKRTEAVKARINEVSHNLIAQAEDLRNVESCTCHTGCYVNCWCRCLVCH